MGIQNRKELLKSCNPNGRILDTGHLKLSVVLWILSAIFIGIGVGTGLSSDNVVGLVLFILGLILGFIGTYSLLAWVERVFASLQASMRATNELLYLQFSGEIDNALQSPDSVQQPTN